MVAAATKGIGLATARRLSQEGCRVSLCSRDEREAREVASQMPTPCIGIGCDVSRIESINAWVSATRDQLGEPDILVTNTGGPPAGPIDEMTDELWMQGIESTLMNIVRMVRLISPGMRERGWGRIVHITSVVAKEPTRMLPISSTLRSGIMAMTRLQASEYGPDGVTVNGILPGHTLTDRQIHLADLRAEREGITRQAALDEQAQHAALRRLASPEEIADPIVFLCSERASFITGTSLLVDGGCTKTFM